MQYRHVVALVLIGMSSLWFLTGCDTDPHVEGTPDRDADLFVERDAGPDTMAAPDVDASPSVDADAHIAPDNSSQSAAGPNLESIGGDGFLLRGTVLAPDGVLDPGEVAVEGNRIICVDTDCSADLGSGDFTVVETHGVISPGLIDAHNHLPYNFLPPWFPNPLTTFNNRYEWADEAAYRAHIAPYGDNRSRGTHYCPAAKWGELRSLIHATTTIQGQSFQQRCVDWAVRNADHYHGLQHNHMRTTIASARDITDDQATSYVDSFEAENNPTTRLAIHMAEGHSGRGIEDEFDSFAGRDDRDNRHAGVSLLSYGTGMLIHAVGLTIPQLEEVYLTNSQIVWSPSSNFHLYGEDVTAPIEDILAWEITTGLGPDWTVSGAFDMLDEMQVAMDYGERADIASLTPERIWKMATSDGAKAVGLHDYIGRLQPGLYADIAIFGRHGDDPYQAVLESDAHDVELVLIDGQAYFGDAALGDAARNEYCDDFNACGSPKFLCAKDGPDAEDRRHERVHDIRGQLVDILDGREDAPPQEQYGRGDELLELAICDR